MAGTRLNLDAVKTSEKNNSGKTQVRIQDPIVD